MEKKRGGVVVNSCEMVSGVYGFAATLVPFCVVCVALKPSKRAIRKQR